MKSPVPEYIDHFLYPLVGNRMLELGNKKTGNASYKSYFVQQGIDHVSIDWNGMDGALKMDLRKRIELDPFDMVTNFGTTEHVSEQYPVWENIHRLCKVGGVIVSMCPMPGDWWWHGEWYPKESFYVEFARLNCYMIEHLAIGRQHPNRNIDVRMVKVDDMDFVMPPIEHMFRNTIRPR